MNPNVKSLSTRPDKRWVKAPLNMCMHNPKTSNEQPSHSKSTSDHLRMSEIRLRNSLVLSRFWSPKMLSWSKLSRRRTKPLTGKWGLTRRFSSYSWRRLGARWEKQWLRLKEDLKTIGVGAEKRLKRSENMCSMRCQKCRSELQVMRSASRRWMKRFIFFRSRMMRLLETWNMLASIRISWSLNCSSNTSR